MFFTIHKLESRVEELGHLRYYNAKEIFPLLAYDDIRSRNEVVQAPPVKGKEFEIRKNDFLLGRDRYFWVEKDITLPEAKDGYEIVGYFDFGKTGGGNNNGFEALLYVDGNVYQGVDSNHEEVFFNDSYRNKNAHLQFLLWSGLEGGGEKEDQIMHIKRAEIGYLHSATDELYYIGNAIVKTIHLMEDTNPVKEKLLKALNDTFLKIDLYEEREVLYKQVENAYAILLNDLEKIGKNHDVTVYCVGHTHIDVAWLWRIKHTKEKSLRSFSSVLRLMERYEDYLFVQSQSQLYKYVKENYPKFYEEMKERIKEGRFEPNGGMWVEADCNISSGEALVRQFLYGINFFKKEFGIASTCLWLPDVFGYSWALPQILKQCNLDTFMTTKISWNEYNKIPHDTFNWRGIDGTEVLTHFITTPEEGGPEHYSYFTYNGLVNAETVTGAWDNYKDKGLSEDVIISYGYGDGGGGPNREMIMMRRALDKVPGIPNVKTTTVKDYFNKLHENVKKSNGYIHSWVGELYFENHRGTYTTQAYNKLMNRKLEYYATQVEALGVLGQLLGGTYDKEAIDKVWELILVNQFHDIIPGSSIREVYEDSKIDYELCVQKLDEVRKGHTAKTIDDKEDAYSFFNFTPFEREDIVFIKEARDGRFVDKEGNKLNAEKIKDGFNVCVKLVPTGFTTIFFEEGCTEKKESVFAVDINNKQIETPFYSIMFNDNGLITKLFDKENNRSVIKGYGNRLTVFEDIPIEFDAWNLDLDHINKYEIIENLVSFEVVSAGVLELELALEYNYRKSTIKQVIKLYSSNRRIDFVTNVYWHENHKFLKTCFDVDVFAAKATYDIQFGNLERNTHFSTSWDYAKFEVVAHKWVDLSETGYGVSLLNNCKYGHSVKDSLMSISLIKCSTWPDTQADQGEHNFTYSLLPHKGTWQEAEIQKQAEFLNQDLYALKGMSELSGKSLFKVSDENIYIDAIKMSEDGQDIVIRIHEYMGRRNDFVVESDFKIAEYAPVNMLEEAVGEKKSSSKIEDFIKPYEIKNYRIKLDI